MWSTTGSRTRLCRHASLTRDPRTGSRSVQWTNRSFETGYVTQTGSTPDPQLIQREVHYEITVGIPSMRYSPGLSRFGIRVVAPVEVDRYLPSALVAAGPTVGPAAPQKPPESVRPRLHCPGSPSPSPRPSPGSSACTLCP